MNRIQAGKSKAHERRASLPLVRQDFVEYLESREFKAKQRRELWRVVMWFVLVIVANVTACLGVLMLAIAPQMLAWVLVGVGIGSALLAWVVYPTIYKELIIR